LKGIGVPRGINAYNAWGRIRLTRPRRVTRSSSYDTTWVVNTLYVN
jgi:hypothetical protein